MKIEHKIRNRQCSSNSMLFFRESIKDFHDRMFDVFQKMPPRLMLIMRNLNIIRSIVKVGQYFYSFSIRFASNGGTTYQAF